MQQIKWEYTTCSSMETANTLGQQGWEAVGFYYYGSYTIMMKRQILE